MKVAIVGSRNVAIKDMQIASYLLEGDEIVSGGAK